MYHIYQTNGWVLGSIEAGEANRFLEIFTSDLGLIRGMAQGVRKLDSKLRYGLQDYSFGKISLVKGRLFWRIVGAERSSDFARIYEDKKVFKLVCRIFSLLKRLIKGEEKDAAIFEDVNSAIRFMDENVLSDDVLASLEIVLVFRILHKLGYVGEDIKLNHLVDFSDWSGDVLKIDDTTRTKLLKQINNSLAHSQL